MTDILTAAQANSGSFYHFFQSKRAILVAVLDSYLDVLRPGLLEPAWKGIHDPIERIFALLAHYRELMVQTGCTYGCPIGRLALEISPGQREIHRRLALNFEGWTTGVHECLKAAAAQLPTDANLEALSSFVLAVMEGGVMLSRSHGTIEPFDAAISELRTYFSYLLEVSSRTSHQVFDENRSAHKELGFENQFKKTRNLDLDDAL
jgi:TetR/AcrR family transcriptional regulator, transcriptional repressor for nem operon